METIKVNMTPCEDVQTIHASQNDNEAREWGFELHNNGEKIDSSSISDQLVFKAYKGGTEQILPENGSTPTTSPFLGDIKYPQGLLTDQEFTYRESPTESDGLTKITDIKGNTLVWNQIYNVNSDRTALGVNIKVVNGAVSITGTSNNIRTGPTFAWTDFKCVLGHKYIITKDFTLPNGDYIFDQYNLNSSTDITTVVFTVTNSGEYIIPQLRVAQSGVTYNINGHLCVYDLTKMFGAGNEPSTVEEFTSLFPLPYYAYNQGTLLSFMGNGIKTVGKNLIDIDDVQIGKAWNGAPNTARAVVYAPCFPNTQYTLSFGTLNVDDILLIEKITEDATTTKRLSSVKALNPFTFTTSAESYVFGFQFNKTNISVSDLNGLNLQIEFGSSATDYEPYTSSTLSLPISTYFPNGMNGFNGVYDELTENKAITRYITRVFNGTENWAMETLQGLTAFYINLGDGQYNTWETLKRYCMCDKFYGTPYNAPQVGGRAYGQVALTGSGTYVEFFADYQTVTEWKTWLSNNPTTFVYEAKTVTEVSFTTASLVTENAEIPLSNEDGILIGKCTEQLSSESGFFDAKIKLTDSDGECYSNKIQLHVERSPQ